MSRRPFDCCTVHSNSTNRLHTDTRGVQSQEQVPTHTLKWFLTSNLYDPGSVVQRVCFGLWVSRMRSVNTDAHQISGLTPVFCFYIFFTCLLLCFIHAFEFDLPLQPCYSSVVMATGPLPMGKELLENSTVVEGKIKINDPLLQK